uniref:Uncharacterized protein n=1 Tax=Tetranychus urticae TaxID=32264 RepID=T1L4X9_TETUR
MAKCCIVKLTEKIASYIGDSDAIDPVSKLLVWEIGSIETSKSPFVRGTINLQSG